MPIRCGDCTFVTKNLSRTKYLCDYTFTGPEVRPRKAWKCPLNAFLPTEKAHQKYRKFGRHWSFKTNLS
jgi:hypothetical protein